MKATTITEQELEQILAVLRDAWSEYSEWIQVDDARLEDTGKGLPYRIDVTRDRRNRLRGSLSLIHKIIDALDDMSAHQELKHFAAREKSREIYG
ncbi:hypothetical protein K7H20_23005 [Salipiger manganoxidans]|uniref:hypothetical protein n=1 Tax=Salipiger marinus TaxID=555512 RepID=UPI001E442B31|nr:hypothetical protein [Salipiger manganoxidans]MCD1620927.1 hypothetical protein [Salipiger manganoxidans]